MDTNILNQQTEMVPVTLLRPHPRNARQGDIGAVFESIKQNGFFGFLIVQRGTCYILAGNHRYLAAVQAGYQELPVVWVDVDDQAALRILLADNRTSDKATYNDARLAELLTELAFETEAKLAGTGYDETDLENLLRDLNRPATPEEPVKRKGEDRYAIVILCTDQEQQEAFEGQLRGKGYEARKTILNERTTLAIG